VDGLGRLGDNGFGDGGSGRFLIGDSWRGGGGRSRLGCRGRAFAHRQSKGLPTLARPPEEVLGNLGHRAAFAGGVTQTAVTLVARWRSLTAGETRRSLSTKRNFSLTNLVCNRAPYNAGKSSMEQEKGGVSLMCCWRDCRARTGVG